MDTYQLYDAIGNNIVKTYKDCLDIKMINYYKMKYSEKQAIKLSFVTTFMLYCCLNGLNIE